MQYCAAVRGGKEGEGKDVVGIDSSTRKVRGGKIPLGIKKMLRMVPRKEGKNAYHSPVLCYASMTSLAHAWLTSPFQRR